VEELINRFNEVVAQSYSWQARWKAKTGKRVIGCFPMSTPEEIIHAAGMLPVTLLGSEESITLADKYIPTCICSLMRSNFDMALKGDYDFLDGIVFPDICDAVRRIADIWMMHQPVPFYHNLGLPVVITTPSSKSCLIGEFTKLKASLEKFYNIEISEEALNKSITVYNENRSLLKRLNELRREKPSLFKARDFAQIVEASMLMPKEEHSQLLTRLLDQAEAMSSSDSNIKLVLAGNPCHHPQRGILNLLDELGASVVDDDLYVGTQYFTTLTEYTTDPIDALAQRYRRHVPYTTKLNLKNSLGDHLLEIVRRAEAKGVVILGPRYCDFGFDYPDLSEKLSQNDVPELFIQTEQTLSVGQIRTRLQAFIEILEGK